MNVKPIPKNAALHSVKETSEDNRHSRNSQPGTKDQSRKQLSVEKNEETASQETALEAADEAFRASQPTNTQAIVDLLSHPTPQKSIAKFPTPKAHPHPTNTAKKLNQKA